MSAENRPCQLQREQKANRFIVFPPGIVSLGLPASPPYFRLNAETELIVLVVFK